MRGILSWPSVLLVDAASRRRRQDLVGGERACLMPVGRGAQHRLHLPLARFVVQTRA